jgi:signal transduction histidine kinase/DNA-binding response OmpR family regulator
LVFGGSDMSLTPGDPGTGGDADYTPAHVLVVDDEPSVADVCREFLSGEGLSVTVAESGEEALRLLQEVRPDVILTDINLPGLSGLEVLRHAKQADPDACVIVLTGYASTSSAIEALRQGADEYVTKPFDLEAVHKIVKSGIANRRLKLENRRMTAELREKNEILRGHEAELRTRVEVATTHLRTLYDVGQEISVSLELGPRLALIAARAADTTGATAAAVYLRRESADEFRVAAAYGVTLSSDPHDGGQFGPTEGVLGLCAAQQKTIRSSTAGGGTTLKLPGLAPGTCGDLMAVPLVSDNATVGVLALADKPDGFDEDDEDFMTLFAAQAAIAVRNSQLYEHTKSLDRLKSEFVAVVSHEIRTPLTSVKGAIELLADEHYFQNNEQQIKLLTIAHANAERLLVLISDILDFSKLESASLPMHLERQRIEPVLQQAAANLRTLLEERRIQFETRFESDLPELMIDGGRITQVVTNLLSNAIKFSPPGERVELLATSEGGRVRVSVRDRGEGIAPQNLGKLFQKFSQVDTTSTRRAGGTGLGLVICKGIVEQHGGTIHVESAPGLGSTFSFLLPPAPVTAGEQAA